MSLAREGRQVSANRVTCKHNSMLCVKDKDKYLEMNSFFNLFIGKKEYFISSHILHLRNAKLYSIIDIFLHGSKCWQSLTRPRGLMLTCERIHLLFDLI